MILYHGSNTVIEYMKEGAARDVVMLLVEEHGMAMANALDRLYSSRLFAKLCDPATGLYCRSARYLLDRLLSE